jgi:hypothetical protein
MKPTRLYPLLSTFALACTLSLALAPCAHAADNILHDIALEFIVDEFVPTLLALATAALREPMTWGVIGAVVLIALVRHRLGRCAPGRSQGQPPRRGQRPLASRRVRATASPRAMPRPTRS